MSVLWIGHIVAKIRVDEKAIRLVHAIDSTDEKTREKLLSVVISTSSPS